MNDLADLNWDNKPANSLSNRTNPPFPVTRAVQASAPPLSRNTTPPTFPLSGRSTPAPPASQNVKTSAQDSFASLLSSNAKKPAALSLQERQKQLLEEKARQLHETYNDKSYVNDASFFEGLGSGRSTPAQGGFPAPTAAASVGLFGCRCLRSLALKIHSDC